MDVIIDKLKEDIEKEQISNYMYIWFSEENTANRIIDGKERPHIWELNGKNHVVSGATFSPTEIPSWVDSKDIRIIGMIPKNLNFKRYLDLPHCREDYNSVLKEAFANSRVIASSKLKELNMFKSMGKYRIKNVELLISIQNFQDGCVPVKVGEQIIDCPMGIVEEGLEEGEIYFVYEDEIVYFSDLYF